METATPTICPACSFEQDDGTETCLRCGVIFSKVRSDWPPRKPTFSASIPERNEPTGHVWKLLAECHFTLGEKDLAREILSQALADLEEALGTDAEQVHTVRKTLKKLGG